VSHVDKPADKRPPASIEDDIEATRERLAGTIDQLVVRANPKNIAKREYAGLKAHFVYPHGRARMDNILKVAAGVAGFVVLAVVVRKASS
jgi:hypothetical protein